jgi:hypothetical protein
VIVRTRSGTTYEFRYRYAPEGWDGKRYSHQRRLHFPVDKWEQCFIPRAPKLHHSLEVHFPSIVERGGGLHTPVTFIEITDEEREIFEQAAA